MTAKRESAVEQIKHPAGCTHTQCATATSVFNMADDEITSEPGFGASGYGFDNIGKSVLYDVDPSGTICPLPSPALLRPPPRAAPPPARVCCSAACALQARSPSTDRRASTP